MNDASRWRFALGQRIGEAYAADPKARVVMIAGSTGRGAADRYSDLEIDVYWSETPTDAERRAAVDRSGGTLHMLYEYEEDEWSEEILFGTFKVGTSTFLVETMERYLTQAVDHFDADDLAQMRLASVLSSQTLVGDDLVQRWQATAAAYPVGLARAIVQASLDFGFFAYGADMFAARDDLIVLHDIFVTESRRLMRVLLALNRTYLPTPNLKAMNELITAMSIAPINLSPRLKSIFHLPPPEAVQTLRALLEETMALVETHLSDLDTTPFHATLNRPRGAWDGPPSDLNLDLT